MRFNTAIEMRVSVCPIDSSIQRLQMAASLRDSNPVWNVDVMCVVSAWRTDPAVPSGKFTYVLHSCIITWMRHCKLVTTWLAQPDVCVNTQSLQELLQAIGLSRCSLKFQTVIPLIFQNVIISLNSFVPRHVTKCAGLPRQKIARLSITCALQISSRDVTAMCTAQCQTSSPASCFVSI